MKAKIAIPLIFLTVFAGVCPNAVTIPAPASDHVPNLVFTILGSLGDNLNPATNGLHCDVCNVDLGAVLTFDVSALNTGGVKALDLTIQQNGSQLYNVSASPAPDANGKVPDALEITGSNGAGGVGNQPIRVTATSAIVATAVGTNYNNGTAALSATLVPVDHASRNVPQFERTWMGRDITSSVYRITYPSQPNSGYFTSLISPSWGLLLLKNGKGAADCSDPSATVAVPAGGSFPGAQVGASLKDVSPTLWPFTLSACVIGAGPGQAAVPVTIGYQLN
jgi:hypothetical protein